MGTALGIVVLLAPFCILYFLIIRQGKKREESNAPPWRLLTHTKVQAYRNLRRERVNLGIFFDVVCVEGHAFEMSGAQLCWHLDGLGEYVQCPQCLKWTKVLSVMEGRAMTEDEKNEQQKDYEAWRAYTIRHETRY